MTSVSTKVPASRTNGSGMGGPLAAPRVVGKRRIRAGGIALAVILLAFGAALSGIALLSVSRTSSYIALKQDVSAGATITAGDLTTVQLSGGSQLNLIPASAQNAIAGRYATAQLFKGSLLTGAEISTAPIVGVNQDQLSFPVRASNVPGGLHTGSPIVIVPSSAITANTSGASGAAPAAPSQIPATLISVSKPGTDGNVTVHVAIDSTYAATVVSLTTGTGTNGVGFYLKAGS